ncbi:UNVERIFIED_ORG: hypothetical protein J2W19_001095 [Shinella zoogloeoides]|nr:hypothetical protein [Shinella zoogloeoides]
MEDRIDYPKRRRRGNATVLPYSVMSDEEAALVTAHRFPQAVLFLARRFISIHETAPRVGGLFATQQRWLMCHAALGHYFRGIRAGGPGLTRRNFGQLALRYGISSRNTALAFCDEALQYEVIRAVENRSGELEPCPATLALLTGWYDTHLRALDLIDDGNRAMRFLTHPHDVLSVVAPLTADRLLSNSHVRSPGTLYTIFSWAEAGGLLMDRLIAGADLHMPDGHGSFVTDVTSISSLAEAFKLSRPHTGRKLSAAEAVGAIGWTGRRGHSPIWIARAFYEEYAVAQARKLNILEHAFEEAMTMLASTAQ